MALLVSPMALAPAVLNGFSSGTDPALAEDDMVELVRILARFRKDAGDFTDPRPIPDPL